MNHSTSDKAVYIKVTPTYRPSSESVKGVKPVWLDIDQCVDSDYSNPVGILRHSLGVERQRAGKVIAAVGHMHGPWAAVEATNESRAGGSICRSDAKLHPTDVHGILSMSTCTGDPLAVVRRRS